MPILPYDFREPEQAKKFPRHGWAENTQGTKLLWLPILQTVKASKTIRDSKGISKALTPGESANQYAFGEAVKRLSVVLREMHRIQRDAASKAMPPKSTEDWYIAEQVHYLVPCYIDLAYVYLRRLADFTTEAIRPALFENYKSSPIHFDELREALQKETIDNRWKPIVEISRLKEAYSNHSSWYDRLSSVSLDGKKGIRDSMEHRLSFTSTVTLTTNHQPAEILAFHQAKAKDVDKDAELLSTLRKIVEELCSFWTEICSAIAFRRDYTQSDVFPPFGDDPDVTGCWPQL